MELNLQNFRDAIGVKNRGYLKLDGETVTKQGNSFLGSIFNVGSSGTVEENLAVREGFVKALSDAGATTEFLTNVRRQLGLEPVARKLLDRKLVAKIIQEFDLKKYEMMPNLADLALWKNARLNPELMALREQAVKLLSEFSKLPVSRIDVLSNGDLALLAERVRYKEITDVDKLQKYIETLVEPRFTSDTALSLLEKLEVNENAEAKVDTSALHLTKKGEEIVGDTPREVVARLGEAAEALHDLDTEVRELTEDVAALKETNIALAKEQAAAEERLSAAQKLTDEDISKLGFLDRIKARFEKAQLANGALKTAVDDLAEQIKKNEERIAAAEVRLAECAKERLALQERHDELLIGKNPVIDVEERQVTQSFEQKVRGFVANLFSSEETWQMDRTKGKPGKRLRALFAENIELVATLCDMTDAERKRAFTGPLGDVVEELVAAIEKEAKKIPSLFKNIMGMGAMFRAGFQKMTNADFAAMETSLNAIIEEKSMALADEMGAIVERALKGDVAQQARQKVSKLAELQNASLDDLVKGALDVEHGYGKFMKDAMIAYLKDAPNAIKRQMFAAAIRYSEYQPPIDSLGLDDRAREKEETKRRMKTFGAMLKGAGPILQKMMQGLSEMPIDGALKLALRDMKSNLAPIPEQMVKAHLLSIVENSEGKIKAIRVTQNLGAATVGQAFLCVMTCDDGKGGTTETEVVVKLLRPDVMARAEAEKKLFIDVAEGGMKNTFLSQLSGILAEFDLTKEADNVGVGQVYTGNPFNGISSMKLHPLAKATPEIMVLEKAPGTTVERYLSDTRTQYKAIVKDVILTDANGEELGIGFKRGESYIAQLARRQEAFTQLSTLREQMAARQKQLLALSHKWVGEALFGSGFYHGDMHGGNIMIDPTVDPEQNKGVTVIDFGNAHKLSRWQQENILLMLGSAAARDTNRFLDGFRALLPESAWHDFDAKRNTQLDDDHPSLHTIIHTILNKGTQRDTGPRILAALQELQKAGLELPGPIFNFSQSQMRLQGVIDQVNKQIAQVDGYLKALAKSIDDGTGSGFPLFAAFDREETPTDLVEDVFRELAIKAQDEYRAGNVDVSRTELPLTDLLERFEARRRDIDGAAGANLVTEGVKCLLESENPLVITAKLNSIRAYASGFTGPEANLLQFKLTAFEAFWKKCRPKQNLQIEHHIRYERYSILQHDNVTLKNTTDTMKARIEELRKNIARTKETLDGFDDFGYQGEEYNQQLALVKAQLEEDESELEALLPKYEKKKAEYERVNEEYREAIAATQDVVAREKNLPEDVVGDMDREGLNFLAEDLMNAYRNAQRAALDRMIARCTQQKAKLMTYDEPTNFFGMMADLLKTNLNSCLFRLGMTSVKWKLRGRV